MTMILAVIISLSLSVILNIIFRIIYIDYFKSFSVAFENLAKPAEGFNSLPNWLRTEGTE